MFSCVVCNRAFNEVNDLTDHYKLRHSGEKVQSEYDDLSYTEALQRLNRQVKGDAD